MNAERKNYSEENICPENLDSDLEEFIQKTVKFL